MGPCLIELEILADIPTFGKAALIAGYIIDLYSDSDSLHAGRGYFNLAVIFEYRACHASSKKGTIFYFGAPFNGRYILFPYYSFVVAIWSNPNAENF